MAAKERKSAISKHLNKDSQLDKSTEVTKVRRGRKSASSLLNDNKPQTDVKNISVGRKKKKECSQEDRITPTTRKRRNAVDVEEEVETAKTPPPTSFRSKKAFLEKELEDILENATGRNTPSTPRHRKMNEKEEDTGESEKLARTRKGGSDGSDIVDDKSPFFLSKIRKGNEKDLDDDNISVKSFSTLVRTRKNLDKDIDDDTLSVRSMNLKSRRNEVNNDDAASVTSISRPNLVKKVGRKKKTVPVVVKKKIFLKRGRPKKNQNDPKTIITSKKRGPKRVVDDLAETKESKRILNKSLKFQNKMGGQRRLRSAMLMKKQKLKKTKLVPDDKPGNKQSSRMVIPVKDVGDAEKMDLTGQQMRNEKERLRLDDHGIMSNLPLLESSELMNIISAEEPKKDGKTGTCKRRLVKKEDGKKSDGKFRNEDMYYYGEGESASTGKGKGNSEKVNQKMRQAKMKMAKKGSYDVKKRKRVPGFHFETTSSPDDSSVIIVQPCIGPKMKYSRLKPIILRTNALNKPGRKMKSKEIVPNNVLPIASSATVSNFNQIGSSYFVQSLPNFKLLATNSTIIRSYNTTPGVNTNFDSNPPGNAGSLSYVEESDQALTTFGPKVSPNDIIVTPSGIVLSNSRIISPGNQNTSNICLNGPNPAFLSDSSNSNILYSSQKSVGNMSTTELFYQKSSNIIQPQSCTKTTTAILLERPESMTTSLISTTTGTVVINSNGALRLNNATDVGRWKTAGFTTSTQTDTAASEKALEGEVQSSDGSSASDLYRNIPNLECLPKIPVAKNVNELLLLKSRTSNADSQVFSDAQGDADKTDRKIALKRRFDEMKDFESIREKKESFGSKGNRQELKRTKRTLRNVRQNHTSVSELTFSEPENSCCETEDRSLYKTISCERLTKASYDDDCSSKVLLQLGSEPITISDTLGAFETASSFLLNKNKINEKLMEIKYSSSKTKGAIEVCKFSKENEDALRELGLDSDLDQTKSEVELGSSSGRIDDDIDVVKSESRECANKERVKEEVDNILKEMPNRKIPNLIRKSQCFNISKNKIEIKNPLVVKNNDYLSKSPSKPPTVIDKLLERNKSLKKAEQEGKYQNSVRNLSENLIGFDKTDLKHKKSLREVRSRKYSKGEQRRLVASKRFVNTNSGCKVFERRGSNPEIYSTNYLSAQNNISNENVPLRHALDFCDAREKYQRRGSIDYESIQKVIERRNSLPIPSENLSEMKFSKNAEDLKKLKTDKIKTILIGSNASPQNKNHESENQPRVINIITGDDGSKKGQNLMDEIGMEIEKDNLEKIYLNGENNGRRTSVESSNSESESLKKLMEGLTSGKRDGKLAKEVPYSDDKNSVRMDKVRLSLDRKSVEDKERKSAIIEESPEDLVTKETILSALGLQSLKAAAENAQKKKDSNNSCQSESANYTGTLKTVIKIHRQEKKGNSKTPMKMIYKASSSSSSANGITEEQSNFEQDIDIASKEDLEEDSKNGNGKGKSLVIPEKASSFSIHPGRMCSDVCTYCFGKFGLLDTPCHIAQLKDTHKRRNILAMETHLLADSCLCDACFRHVDKKSNCPTFMKKKSDRRKFTGRKQVCCARNCNADSQHNVRRKWFAKLKKSIGRKIILDQGKLEKLQPGHLVTLCNRHIYWIDYFMSCGICKKRLTSVNMYKVGPDIMDLNAALSADGIPTLLTEERFLCKLCNCYASIRVKCKDPSDMSNSHRQFYETCRKRILQCHEIEVPDSEGEPERESRADHKNGKRTRKAAKPTATVTNEGSKSDNETEVSMEELEKTNECEKDNEMKEISHMNIPPKANGNLDFGGVSITPSTTEVNPTQIHVKLGNLNIGALGNLNIGQDVRHGTRPSDIQCFPTEAELALRAHFDLQTSAEDESAKTPRKGFEKCTTTLQFNPETKNLFYNLQMPYGNHSSFFRHLILLEKYFRNGDLVISRNADPKAINYISSVQNRIRSYEGIHNPVKKPVDISPSLSILPQPIKTETRNLQEIQSSVIQSRPFTLTPMPPTSLVQGFPKNSPLSHIQATVQNIPSPSNQSANSSFIGSLLKSMNQSAKSSTIHPKPEISITSVPNDSPLPVRIGKNSSQSSTALTSRIHENLRNLASKNQMVKPSNHARAVILNRTVGGQKQSLVQVTTGGKTIHLTLSQFRRIQQMQIRKKQYLEHQAKALKMKEDTTHKGKVKLSEDSFDLRNLSSELEIQEIKQKQNGNEIFPLISEVRSLAEDANGWEKSVGEAEDGQSNDSFPKIPKAISVSVTKVPSTDYGPKEQSVESVD